MSTFRIVSATRLSQEQFWAASPLAGSLNKLCGPQSSPFSTDITFDNREGLSTVYNRSVAKAKADQCTFIIFIHDDARIEDLFFQQKLTAAFDSYDVIGIAGARGFSVNTRKIAWWECAASVKAGWIVHPIYDRQEKGCYVEYYGSAPMPCVVIDGVFMATRLSAIPANCFDTQFTYDFYDLDFSLTLHLQGKRVGVWPLAISHMSKGSGKDSARYQRLQKLFRRKFGGRIHLFPINKFVWIFLRAFAPSLAERWPAPRGEFILRSRGMGHSGA